MDQKPHATSAEHFSPSGFHVYFHQLQIKSKPLTWSSDKAWVDILVLEADQDTTDTCQSMTKFRLG